MKNHPEWQAEAVMAAVSAKSQGFTLAQKVSAAHAAREALRAGNSGIRAVEAGVNKLKESRL